VSALHAVRGPVRCLVTLLIAQPATACLGCSLRASRPTRHRCRWAYIQVFLLQNAIFGNYNPFRYKTQYMFWTWSVYIRACVQNFAIVRHGISEEIGPTQNKQTLKYLLDCQYIDYESLCTFYNLDTLKEKRKVFFEKNVLGESCC